MKIIENKNHKADVFLKAWINVRGNKKLAITSLMRNLFGRPQKSPETFLIKHCTVIVYIALDALDESPPSCVNGK